MGKFDSTCVCLYVLNLHYDHLLHCFKNILRLTSYSSSVSELLYWYNFLFSLCFLFSQRVPNLEKLTHTKNWKNWGKDLMQQCTKGKASWAPAPIYSAPWLLCKVASCFTFLLLHLPCSDGLDPLHMEAGVNPLPLRLLPVGYLIITTK